ncbi:MAG: hypothetical protein HKO63_06760 [Acidimicrobiia bacterium]|nr:hypothetical protein [Acidimicrobiia bacterium]NNF11105.1 hypothetical protein [Acidimicrobiia bacterium]NNL97888.1 hypothetical protein [Acidimicrobiia bacterium]
MRKIVTMFIALATLLALALPAVAKPPTSKGQPRLEVTKTAELPWSVHAVGDVIPYTVTVAVGKGSVLLDSVYDPLIPLEFSGGDTDRDGAIDSDETWTYAGAVPVDEIHLALPEIVNTVTVTAGDLTATASATLKVVPYPDCGFTEMAETSGVWTMSLDLGPRDYYLCVWDPAPMGGTGPWTLTGDSAATGKRALGSQITVRDYVPGDWCGAVHERLRKGGQLELTVDLPANGACPGDEWPDANPATFYLATMGLNQVTATR